MNLDADRESAYSARDLLRELFVEAMDPDTLTRFEAHAGGVVKMDLLRGTALFSSGETYPELALNIGHAVRQRIAASFRDLRIRARVSFRHVTRTCVIATTPAPLVSSRPFIVCEIKGKSILNLGKWRVWSAEPWEHRIEWPIPSAALRAGSE